MVRLVAHSRDIKFDRIAVSDVAERVIPSPLPLGDRGLCQRNCEEIEF